MENTTTAPDGAPSEKHRFQLFLISLTALAIGAAFLGLVWDYLVALFMAAIFSAMSAPLYRWLYRHTGSKAGIAVTLTLLILTVGVLFPLISVFILGAEQAASVAKDVTNWAETLDLNTLQNELPEWLPFKVDFVALSTTIAAKVSEAAGQIADFFVSALSQATRGTVAFFLHLFIMVYAMVFFLPQNANMIHQLLDTYRAAPRGPENPQ